MLTVLLHGPNFSVMSSQMISRDDSCSTDKIMFCYMVVVLVLRLFRGQNSELIWATRQKRKERNGKARWAVQCPISRRTGPLVGTGGVVQVLARPNQVLTPSAGRCMGPWIRYESRTWVGAVHGTQ